MTSCSERSRIVFRGLLRSVGVVLLEALAALSDAGRCLFEGERLPDGVRLGLKGSSPAFRSRGSFCEDRFGLTVSALIFLSGVLGPLTGCLSFEAFLPWGLLSLLRDLVLVLEWPWDDLLLGRISCFSGFDSSEGSRCAAGKTFDRTDFLGDLRSS